MDIFGRKKIKRLEERIDRLEKDILELSYRTRIYVPSPVIGGVMYPRYPLEFAPIDCVVEKILQHLKLQVEKIPATTTHYRLELKNDGGGDGA